MSSISEPSTPRQTPAQLLRLGTILLALLLAPSLLMAQDTPPRLPGANSQVGGETSPPHLLVQVDPVPPNLHTAETSAGICKLSLIVDETGRPRQVTILKGISPGMDPAITNAVEQYRFTPALQNGKPAAAAVQITLRVNLPPVRRTGLLRR